MVVEQVIALQLPMPLLLRPCTLGRRHSVANRRRSRTDEGGASSPPARASSSASAAASIDCSHSDAAQAPAVH